MTTNMENEKTSKIYEYLKGNEMALFVVGIFISIFFIIAFINIVFQPKEGDLINEDAIDELASSQNFLDPKKEELLRGSAVNDYLDFYIDQGGRFPPGIALYKIGEEVITTDDYNFYLLALYPEEFNSDSDIEEEIIRSVDEDIQLRSVLLQDYSSRNTEFRKYLLLDENRTPEILSTRGRAVAEIFDNFENEHTQKIKGSRITIWFRNTYIPKMGLENAKKFAFEKITPLREKVVNGELTMQEAGQIVRNDESLVQIDAAYLNNAFISFENLQGVPLYYDEKLNDIMDETEVGEVSEVLLGYDSKAGHEAFYTFFLIEDRTGDGLNIDQYFDTIRDNFLITKYD